MDNSDAQRVANLGIRMLVRREHSAAELLIKLIKKGAPEPAAEQALAWLQEQDLQSDDRYVSMVCRSRIGRSYGPVRIRQELNQKGIHQTLIAEHLNQTESFWLELAEQALRKKFGEIGVAEREDDQKIWARQARFLAQRGFPTNLVYQVLNQTETAAD